MRIQANAWTKTYTTSWANFKYKLSYKKLWIDILDNIYIYI